VTITEIAVLSLGMAILFTCLFVGYALYYRLRIGSGMGSAPVVAERSGATPTRMFPTLVPTFTPTPSPTLPPVATGISGEPGPTPEPTVLTPTPVIRVPASSPPTRLVIPKIAVDIPVLTVGTRVIKELGKSTLIWGDVADAGGFHETSAYPGNPGNTVINGHRDIRGSVFRHLNKLEVGDEIVVYVGNEVYPYNVVETVIVPETFASAKQRAENLKYIGYMPEERLTLVTCTPVGLATHRLLVIAKAPGQIEPQMPEAGSTPTP
jgi:sortase A